jgi:hypothetical protein
MRHRAMLLQAMLTTSILLAWPDAQAAETLVLSLLCDGTMTMTDAQPEPVNKMGLVVNLADRTVTFRGYVAQIESVDDADISFRGEKQLTIGNVQTGAIIVTGHIHRVTNAVSATTRTSATAFTYDLLCKPVSSLF